MKKSLRLKKTKTIKTSGYNPYQTGHGEFEDKSNKRSVQKEELRKITRRDLNDL